LLFDRAAREVVEFTAEYRATEARYQQAFAERRDAAQALLASRDAASRERYRSAQKQLDTFRAEGAALARVASGRPYNDTNHIFLPFVIRYLPAGVVGLIMAAIFGAVLSTISAELNSLATSTVIDLYRRHFRRDAPDRHYVLASRLATIFWGIYAVSFALYGK